MRTRPDAVTISASLSYSTRSALKSIAASALGAGVGSVAPALVWARAVPGNAIISGNAVQQTIFARNAHIPLFSPLPIAPWLNRDNPPGQRPAVLPSPPARPKGRIDPTEL